MPKVKLRTGARRPLERADGAGSEVRLTRNTRRGVAPRDRERFDRGPSRRSLPDTDTDNLDQAQSSVPAGSAVLYGILVSERETLGP
jgi:hypothetical protein